MKNLELLLRLAGYLHFGILFASALVPRGLNWRENLASLHPFLRRMFWVYGVFIVLMIVSFGTLTLRHGNAMVGGDAIAKSICAVIAIFWLARLLVQLFVFDAKPFLTNWFYKIGYNALTVVFTYFVFVYGWVVLH